MAREGDGAERKRVEERHVLLEPVVIISSSSKCLSSLLVSLCVPWPSCPFIAAFVRLELLAARSLALAFPPSAP